RTGGGDRRHRVERRVAERPGLGRAPRPVPRRRRAGAAAGGPRPADGAGRARRRPRRRVRGGADSVPAAGRPDRRRPHRHRHVRDRARRVRRARRAADRPPRRRRGRDPRAARRADRGAAAPGRRPRRPDGAGARPAARRGRHDGHRRHLPRLAADHGDEKAVNDEPVGEAPKESNPEAVAGRPAADRVALGYRDRVVTAGLSVDIPDRTFTAVVGANACGKSSLLRSFARLLPPAHGLVTFDGRDVRDYRPKSIARQVGFLPQGLVPPDNIAVRQLVARGRYPYQTLLSAWSRDDERALAAAMAAAGVADLAERPVESLSGGQRQRVWIAMILAQETPYLLLDEPTTFLDITHQYQLLALLARLRDEGR